MNSSQTNKGCGTYKQILMEIQENGRRLKLYSLSIPSPFLTLAPMTQHKSSGWESAIVAVYDNKNKNLSPNKWKKDFW